MSYIDDFISLLVKVAGDKASSGEQESLRKQFLRMMNAGKDTTRYGPAQFGTDSDKLDGQHGSYYQNASNINAGTLPTDRFSAYADLEAESKIGTGATQVAGGTHTHEDLEISANVFHKQIGLDLIKYGIVLERGAAGQWDDESVTSPFIFYDQLKHRYAMLYTGYDGTTIQIGLAWSDDLLTWTKDGGNPFFAPNATGGTPDDGGVLDPFIYQENGTYYLFYIGLTSPVYEDGTPTICLATSTDMATWTRHGTIIGATTGWRSAKVIHPNVVKTSGTYYLFFSAMGSIETIGYATSTDLMTWTVDDVNSPVLSDGASGTWDAAWVGFPFVWHANGFWYMAYYGANGSYKAQDGLAWTTEDNFPLGWTKHINNPMLPYGGAGDYDEKHAHKPAIFLKDGVHYHFYVAVDASDVAEIALATEGVPTTGVTNGDAHDHVGGDGAQIDHTGLSNIGTNSHAQLDTFKSLVELGWIDLGLSATYVSATSFTVSGDYTAYFKLGTKIRLVNSTTKYGYVLSSSYASPNTTVNLVSNTTHTLAAGAITDLRLSYGNPPDFPDWLGYPATVTYYGGTTDPTSDGVLTSFVVHGRVVHLLVSGYLTRGTGDRTAVSYTLPITYAGAFTGSFNITFFGVINCPNRNSGAVWYIGLGGMNADGYYRGILTYRI